MWAKVWWNQVTKQNAFSLIYFYQCRASLNIESSSSLQNFGFYSISAAVLDSASKLISVSIGITGWQKQSHFRTDGAISMIGTVISAYSIIAKSTIMRIIVNIHLMLSDHSNSKIRKKPAVLPGRKQRICFFQNIVRHASVFKWDALRMCNSTER